MNTKIGIGYSNQTVSEKAGREAAELALKNGNIERPDFALVFSGGKHNPHDFIKGINQVLPNVPKAGGSSFGIITDDFIGYDGFEVGVTIFSSDTIRFQSFAVGGLNENEFEVGKNLGKKIEEATTEDSKGLFVFYDSSKQQNPPMLNFATPLFEGMKEFLPKDLVVAGGGFLADMMLSSCYQYLDNDVYSQNAVGILMSGSFSMDFAILHGCEPCSDYVTITKTHGPVVQEIDNKPAIDVLDELLGTNHGINVKDFAMNVTLGINRGDKFGDFKESDYANRLTLAVDEENKALIMFEPDLTEGMDVQLMRRSLDPEYVVNVISNLKEKANNPSFAFYINCGGRAKPFSGVGFEDATEVQKALGDIPMAGFYSGVEVAKVGDTLQALDWTGVLCLFSDL